IQQLRSTIQNAPRTDLAAKMARKRSPLRLALNRASGALRGMRVAIARQAPRRRVIARRRRLAHALDRFTFVVKKVHGRSQMSDALSDTLVATTHQASVATAAYRP